VSAQSTSGWLRFGLRVNGIEFREASLRPGGEGHSSLEIVIRDRQLGSFAIHEEFLLEVQEGKEDNPLWRPVSITELKDAISREARTMDSDFSWSLGSSLSQALQRLSS
jgi:hypothetical protein